MRRALLLLVILPLLTPVVALSTSQAERCCLEYPGGEILDGCQDFDTDACAAIIEGGEGRIFMHRDNTVFIGYMISYLIIAALVFYIVNHLISQHGLIERR